MFKDDYTNQMDNINADEYIKNKVRLKLTETQTEPTKKPKRHYFLKTVAAALSLVLVFSLGTIVGKNNVPTTAPLVNNKKEIQNYDKIYSALADFKPSFFEEIKEGFVKYNSTKGEISKDFVAEVDNATYTLLTEDSAEISHSETTTQVDGVDEADDVKTDGKYIYILNRTEQNVKIVEAGIKPKQVSKINVNTNESLDSIYISDDRLVILCDEYEKSQLKAFIYDISNPSKPKFLHSCTQSGSLNTSRLIGNKLYVISNYYVDVNNMVKSDSESYVPSINCEKYNGTVAPETVHLYNECQIPEYTVISAYNIKYGTLISTQSVLGGTETVYSSTDNIITTSIGGGNETQIARFKIQDGIIEFKASAKLSGRLLNQFSIDEYNGHFRFVLTQDKTIKEGKVTKEDDVVNYEIGKSTTVNSLVILNEELKETGKITDIAPEERVYSVRFMGDTAYFVTFRETDPLFSVDVSNPKAPKIIGALKIPGFSNYLFPYGNGKLLGIGQNADEKTGITGSMKLSMFDISNPTDVTENSKTDIPADYSEALYNHKAVLVDINRNIIAFSADKSYGSSHFYVYSYENGKFIKKLDTEINEYSDVRRGAYIGKTFYIITDYSVEYYNIATFDKLGELVLE